MKIKKDSICRDNGDVFLRVFITGLNTGSYLHVVSITSQELEINCLLQIIQRSTDGCTAIVVFPKLSTSLQRLVFREFDKAGNLLAEVSSSINNDLIKWRSKFNYLRKPDAMALMKAVPRRDLTVFPEVELMDVLVDAHNNEYVVRVNTTFLSQDSEKIQVSFFDSTAQQLGTEPLILRQSIEKINIGAMLFRSTIETSIRVPLEHHDYLVLVGTKDYPASKGYKVFESNVLQDYALWSKTTQEASLPQPADYLVWLNRNSIPPKVAEAQKNIGFPKNNVFSIIVPIHKTPLHFFEEMVLSVKNQTYACWELVLVNSSPENIALKEAIAQHCKDDSRIVAVVLDGSQSIAVKNSGAAAASGDFLCFLDHDDTIEPDTLYEYAKAISRQTDIDMLYCDEDIISEDGLQKYALFKPDFNLDLLRAKNYLTHFLAIRSTLYAKLGPSQSEYDGAQDYDLCLRASEVAQRIHHVPRVLYHWRESQNSTVNNPDNKSYAAEAGRKALQAHLDRCGVAAEARFDKHAFSYITSYLFDNVEESPLISIIIPSKDNRDILNRCLMSILDKSTYPNFEIIIVENNSTAEETFVYYDSLKAYPQVTIVQWKEEWNYSKINNFGVEHASGKYLLFLNNDTEVISKNWMEQMLGIGQREEVGVVGAKLYYPDDIVQHAGVFFTEDRASHLFHHFPKDAVSYFNLMDLPQHLSAVTAACMLTKRALFIELGGFSEDFPVAYNDIDYCLRARASGHAVVYTPYAELYHYESASRGYDTNPEKRTQHARDIGLLQSRWPEYFGDKDPSINPNIDKSSPYYEIDAKRQYFD